VKNKPRPFPRTAEEASAGAIVPSPSRDDLRALAEWLRDELRRGQAPPATLASWERIATAIEWYLSDEVDLNVAFGVTPKMGAPKKPERLSRARRADQLGREDLWRGREGMSPQDVYNQLADEGLLSENRDSDAVRKAVAEHKDTFIAEELVENLGRGLGSWNTLLVEEFAEHLDSLKDWIIGNK
jgi:hypothetical protein